METNDEGYLAIKEMVADSANFSRLLSDFEYIVDKVYIKLDRKRSVEELTDEELEEIMEAVPWPDIKS
jgi:hypothetical protein